MCFIKYVLFYIYSAPGPAIHLYSVRTGTIPSYKSREIKQSSKCASDPGWPMVQLLQQTFEFSPRFPPGPLLGMPKGLWTAVWPLRAFPSQIIQSVVNMYVKECSKNVHWYGNLRTNCMSINRELIKSIVEYTYHGLSKDHWPLWCRRY